MFTKRIIPCLDVKDGRVVKGVNFVDLRDAGDPVEIAAAYDAAGADEVVFLDITASSDQRGTVVDMVKRVAEKVFIPFTVGGGIRTVEDFRLLLREGADKISVNSAAIDRPELISEAADKFGSQCVVVAIDAKRREDGSGWNVYKHGGRIDVGWDAVEWAVRAERLGAGEILLTTLDRVLDEGRIRHRSDQNHCGACLHSGYRLGRRRNHGALLRSADRGQGGCRPGCFSVSLQRTGIRQVKEYLAKRGVSVRL